MQAKLYQQEETKMINDERQIVLNLQRPNDPYKVDWVRATRSTKDWSIKVTKPLPPPEFIREILDYNPETGVLTWKERSNETAVNIRFNSRYANKPVGKRDGGGSYARPQISIKYNGIKKDIYYARLVWCWVHGQWPDPEKVIDHINGDHMDDRIENLREVTMSENMRNAKQYKNNTSGVVGVSYDNTSNKWRVNITPPNTTKSKYIGLFKNKEDAIQARKDAEKRYGYHVNHGRV